MYNYYNNPYQQNLQNMKQQLDNLQMQSQTMPVMPIQPVPTQTIQFVKGIEGAKAYAITPSSSIMLMDTDEPKFYTKQADANGIVEIKTYKFEEVKEETPKPAEEPSGNYVLRSDFDDLQEYVNAINSKLEELTATVPRRSTKESKA